jgi:hypothetical protein
MNLLLVLLSLLVLVRGQVTFTDGNATETWENPLNWNTGNVPLPSDDAEISGFPLLVTASTPIFVQDFLLLGSLGVSFGAGLNVTGNVTLYSGSYSPSLFSSSDISAKNFLLGSGSSLFVQGKVWGAVSVLNGTVVLRNATVVSPIVVNGTLQLDNVKATSVVNGTVQQINGISTISGSVSSSLNIVSGTLIISGNITIPNLTLGPSATLHLTSGSILNVTKIFNWNGAGSSIISEGSATINLINTSASFLTGSSLYLSNVAINNYGNGAYSGSLNNTSLWKNEVGSCCLNCFNSAGLNCVTAVPASIYISQDTFNTVITATIFFIVGLILLPVVPIVGAVLYSKRAGK